MEANWVESLFQMTLVAGDGTEVLWCGGSGQENLVSNPLAAISKLMQFCLFRILFIPHCLDSPGCINEYPAIASDGYVNE